MPANDPKKAALLDTLLQSNNLFQSTEKASQLLQNPVAVIDTAYHMLAESSSTLDIADDVWTANSKRKGWNYEFVAKVNKLIDKDGRMISMPALLTDVGQTRRRLESLMLDGAFLGFMVVIEAQSPFEDTDEETYRFARQVLAKALAMDRALQYHGHARHAEGILMDMLNNRFKDRILLRERIRDTEFEGKKSFQVYAVDMAGYMPKNMREDGLKSSLRAIFKQCWSIGEKEHIIILTADNAEREFSRPNGNPNTNERFSAFLRDTGLLSGQSPIFTDLFLVPESKHQAMRALELARDLKSSPFHRPETVLFPYEDYKIADMLSHLPRGKMTSYCSTATQNMHEHDRKNGSEYLKTVFYYLNSGKSIHGAAEKMFLHHNTVYYRLNRAKEIFGIDFSSENANLRHYLSCIMLLYFNDKPAV